MNTFFGVLAFFGLLSFSFCFYICCLMLWFFREDEGFELKCFIVFFMAICGIVFYICFKYLFLI